MLKILVIEDNEDNYAVIEGYLEDEFDLLYAKDGESGFQMVKNYKPDIVLLDISLPEMDGNEVVKEIKKDNDIKNIPVIALTAHAMSGDREKFLQNGFNEYISKPITDSEILISTINRLVLGK